jgi:hypothetical protein
MLGAAMSESTDTRDRVIKLESDLKHLTDAVDGMSAKVTAMHDLLQAAKGARWIIISAAAVGGFVSAKLAAFMPWLSSAPR